jgi:hypothetical protein
MLKWNATYVLLPFCAATFIAISPVSDLPQLERATTQAIVLGEISATIVNKIDARKNRAGDAVMAKSIQATTLLNGITIPAGSVLEGHINSVVPSEDKGDSTLVLTFDRLAIKNGKEIQIKATVLNVVSAPPLFPREPASGTPVGNRVGEPVNNSPSPENNDSSSHPISGLTLSSSANDPTSATLTQTRKNIHLTSDVLVIVSIATVPIPQGNSPR